MGRLLAFRTGDIAADSIMQWMVRDRPDLLVRQAQAAAAREPSAGAASGASASAPRPWPPPKGPRDSVFAR